MKKYGFLSILLSLLIMSGCSGIDEFGANADQAADDVETGLDGHAEAFELEDGPPLEYSDMLEELKDLRAKNEELEEEIYYLTEERDWGAEAYEYFCDYGYDEISDATYDELCN